MNVPKLMPTTSQMICRLVSHIEFELWTLDFGLWTSDQTLSLRATLLNKLNLHPRQNARLRVHVGLNFADSFSSHPLVETFSMRVGGKL
jgi:hypothetical protein